MARPKHTEPRTEVTIRLKPDILELLNTVTLDPFTKKVRFGTRSELIEGLLRAHFSSLAKKEKTNEDQ